MRKIARSSSSADDCAAAARVVVAAAAGAGAAASGSSSKSASPHWYDMLSLHSSRRASTCFDGFFCENTHRGLPHSQTT